MLFFLFKMSTGICQYFSPTTPLASHKDTGIGAVVTREANRGVKRVLEKPASQQRAKRQKRYTNFSDTKMREGLKWVLLIRKDKIANYLN